MGTTEDIRQQVEDARERDRLSSQLLRTQKLESLALLLHYLDNCTCRLESSLLCNVAEEIPEVVELATVFLVVIQFVRREVGVIVQLVGPSAPSLFFGGVSCSCLVSHSAAMM